MQKDVYRLQNKTKNHTPDIKQGIKIERNYICGEYSNLFSTNFDHFAGSFTGRIDMNSGKTVILKKTMPIITKCRSEPTTK